MKAPTRQASVSLRMPLKRTDMRDYLKEDIITIPFYKHKFQIINTQKMILENTVFQQDQATDEEKNYLDKILKIKTKLLNSTYANIFNHADNASRAFHIMIDKNPPDSIFKFISKLLMPVSQLLRIIKVFELNLNQTEQNEFSADIVYNNDISSPKIICRICEKPVLEAKFEEHTKTCIEAYRSTHLVAQIDAEIKEISQSFMNMANVPWPAPISQMLDVLIPIHSVVLLNKLNDNFPTYDHFARMCSSLLSTFNSIENFVKNAALLELIGRAKTAIKKKAKNSLTSFLLLKLAHKTTVDPGAPLSPSNSFAGFLENNISNFKFIDFISLGSTARVFLCERKATGDKFAIKVVPKSYLQNGNNKYHILHEKDLLFRITSDRVAKVCMYYFFYYLFFLLFPRCLTKPTKKFRTKNSFKLQFLT